MLDIPRREGTQGAGTGIGGEMSEDTGDPLGWAIIAAMFVLLLAIVRLAI